MPGTVPSPSPQWEVSPPSLVVPCGFPAEHRWGGQAGSLLRASLPPDTRFAAVSTAPGPALWGGQAWRAGC